MNVLAALVILCAAVAVHGHGSNGIYCQWEDCEKPCGEGLRKCTRTNGKIWWHKCHVQDCEPPSGCGIADIVFVFDSSASIGDKNYWVLKQFAVDVMKGLLVGVNDSRIAAVTYSDIATTQWGFGAYTDEAALEDALWSVPWEAGVTNTQDGLEHARLLIESEARADVKQMVIVITDGESNIKKDQTVPKAEQMHEEGIEIFTIGIGSINEDECRGIASNKKDFHFHYVTNYNALVAITNTVINDTCTSSSLTDCDAWTGFGPCQVQEEGESCGPGLRIRSRLCHFYLWPGAEPDSRTAFESTDCEISCEPEPPVCEDSCTKNECNIDPTPDNCDRFNTCVRMCECMLAEDHEGP